MKVKFKDLFQRSKLASNRGMTLIEIVIVVAIIAFVVGIGIPRLTGRKTEMQGTIRRLGVMVREIKNSAKLYRSTYRLAIEIRDPDALEKGPSRYWVEKTPGSVLVSADEEAAELEANEEDEEDREPSRFQIDARITKGQQDLPGDLYFAKVEVASRKRPFTSGVAYIYFLPEGYVEQSTIHIKSGDKLHWTLALAPVTGKVDVYNKEVNLKDLQR